jgi:DNA-binding MarR family transcriptional regulator
MNEASVEQIRALRQQNIGRLFLRASRCYSIRAVTKLNERGHHDLTLAHTSLLANLDLEGTKITILAMRVGITKQSMGQLVAELEAQGYLERESDPTDKRAALVKFTARGWEFLRDAYEIKLEMDVEFASVMGKDRLAELYNLLGEFVEKVEPSKDGELL